MMWTKAKIGDCCEITSSKRIFFSEYVESGIPFYRSKEIIELSNCQEISDPLYISESKYDEIAHKFGIPQPGDMLLTSVGTIGNYFDYVVNYMLCKSENGDYVISTAAVVFEAKNDNQIYYERLKDNKPLSKDNYLVYLFGPDSNLIKYQFEY